LPNADFHDKNHELQSDWLLIAGELNPHRTRRQLEAFLLGTNAVGDVQVAIAMTPSPAFNEHHLWP
jgi:hypothetical protein